METAFKVQLVRFRIRSVYLAQALLVFARQLHLQLLDDGVGYLLLGGQKFRLLTVVPLAPKSLAVADIDQFDTYY